jgi:hypothetical protein
MTTRFPALVTGAEDVDVLFLDEQGNASMRPRVRYEPTGLDAHPGTCCAASHPSNIYIIEATCAGVLGSEEFHRARWACGETFAECE